MKTGIFKINKDALIEDAAIIMKENRISSLPVIEGDNYLAGIITRTDIFKAFIDIMGVKATGTRIATEDKVGVLADITSILAEHNINIRNITDISENGKSEITIKVRSLDASAAIEDIKAKGYNVTSVITVH